MNSKVPPSLKGEFLLGNARQFTGNALPTMIALSQTADIAMMHFGPIPLMALSHPQFVHDVLVENADKYLKDSTARRVLYPIVGNGIFSSDGDFWKRQRKLVQPAFHSKRIGAYADTMVQHAQMEMANWHDGETRSIDHDMSNLTMSIIAKTLFNADIAGNTGELNVILHDALGVINQRFSEMLPTPEWLPTASNRKLRHAVEQQNALIQHFIDEWRKKGEDQGDLLSMLLLAQDDENQQMTDQQVRDEAMTLFGAGQETTAVTLMWCWYVLSQHREVEARLHDELERVLGGRAPTLADLPKLPYTEMFVKEVMRVYPPAWSIAREAAVDTEIGGYRVKKGMPVLINIYGMHHDARFFEEPEKFIPERFSADQEKLIPKYAYLPFGGGPRVCIGNQFALMETRLVLATLAQHFSMSVAPGFQVIPDRVFTLRPRTGLKMVVRQRVPEMA